MNSYVLYSPEPFPGRTGQRERTPEYLDFNGFRISPVPANTWVPIPMELRRKEYQDFMDTQGHEIVVNASQLADGLNSLFGHRGVIVVHEAELKGDGKKTLEEAAKQKNLEFRAEVLREFEYQLKERTVTGHGRAKPTPYEEECYDLLQWPKPYDLDALRAQRQPGYAVARDIAAALEESALRREQVAVQAMTEKQQGGK